MKSLITGLLSLFVASVAFAATPTCQPQQLKIINALNDGAMCQSMAYYQVENQSNQACQLKDYPQVMTTSTKGKTATITAHKDVNYFVKTKKPTTLTLQPKSSADRFAWFGIYGQCPDDPKHDTIQSIKLRTSDKGKWSAPIKYTGYPMKLSVIAYQAGQYKEQ